MIILIPKIRDIITKKFNNSKINYHLDPKEVVASGAAIRGAKFMNISWVKDIKLFDVGISFYRKKMDIIHLFNIILLIEKYASKNESKILNT